jgi:hypothetical protein
MHMLGQVFRPQAHTYGIVFPAKFLPRYAVQKADCVRVQRDVWLHQPEFVFEVLMKRLSEKSAREGETIH